MHRMVGTVSMLAFAALMAPAQAANEQGGMEIPEWLQRTDITVSAQEHQKPSWEVETIQPLFMDEGHAFFTQLRGAHQSDDETYNAGLGYRYLLEDHSWMFGVNSFYDFAAEHGHERLGLGLEAFNPYVTLRTNYYHAMSGTKTVSALSGVSTTERALDGWDAAAEIPVPYVPWARLDLKAYEWRGDVLKDVNGYSAGLRMYPYSNLELTAGIVDDSGSSSQGFVRATWYFGAPDYVDHTLADGLSESPFTARDIAKNRLEKVRRHHDIVVERRRSGGAGVIIGRRN